MNINEYISSGILESYVLGLAGPEERDEFELMCSQYADLRAARDAFEADLERHSLANAIPVPAQVRSRIFSELEIEQSRSADNASGLAERDIRRPHNKTVAVARIRWSRLLAAAVILLMASTILNFYFFRQYKFFSTKYDDLLARNTEMANNEKRQQTRLTEFEKLLMNPGMNRIRMTGANVPGGPAPNSLATIYWDQQSKDVYLIVNDLPNPAEGKQYQLWAIVDGNPVNAGIFEIGERIDIIRMKNIPKAQAFAITLEKRGGSLVPALDQMYVMGTTAG